METTKKMMAGHGKVMDRLSDLPDSIIVHILSFLEIKNAVQTCVLSQRWQHLWTGVLTLNFDSRSFKNITSFKNFVLKVLSRRGNSKIQSLKFHSISSDKSFTNKVIRYAVLHSVEELYIYKANHLYLVKSPDLLTCKSIKTLRLDYCPLIFDDDHFSRCVNLETLILKDAIIVAEQKVIRISAPRLVLVELELCWRNFAYNNDDEEVGEDWQLLISSPNLSSFRYSNNTMIPLTLRMDEGCPILDRLDIFLLNEIYSERPQFLSNLLKGLILHANLLIVYDLKTKCLEVKTRLENDDDMVHAKIYNKATDEKNELCWRGTREDLDVFLGMIMLRCELNNEEF